jgi:hypothetical protein
MASALMPSRIRINATTFAYPNLPRNPDSTQPKSALDMQAITIIGLDIAKSVFQVHGVDADGQVVLRRQLKRRYVLAFFEKWLRA